MRIRNIEDIKIVGKPRLAVAEISAEEAAAIELAAQEEATAIKKDIFAAYDLYTKLTYLRDSISRYGLTRSLISFADYDKSLSTLIPEIPSIENLTTDKSSKNSTACIEAIQNKINNIDIYIQEKQSRFDKQELVKEYTKYSESTDMEAMTRTAAELKAFRDSVAKYGLTRSLLSFADRDKNLSTYIKEVPAIESLNVDLSVSASADVIAAVEGKVVDILNNFKNKILEFLTKRKKVIEKKKQESETEESKLEKLEVQLKNENRVFNTELSKKTEVYDISFSQLMTIFKEVNTSCEVMLEILGFDHPKNQKEFDGWLSKIISKISSIKGVFEFIPKQDGKTSDNPNCFWRISSTYDHKSLSELEYDSIEKFHTILSEFKKALKSAYTAGGMAPAIMNHDYSAKDDVDMEIVNKANSIIRELYDSYDSCIDWLNYFPIVILHKIFNCTEKKD